MAYVFDPLSISIRLRRYANSTGQSYYTTYIYDSDALQDVLIDEDGTVQKHDNSSYIYGANLTRELNRAGRLTIKVKKEVLSKELNANLLDTRNFIEVVSPYTKDGRPPKGSSTFPYTTAWRGFLSSYSETPNGLTVTYDGEFSLLDKVVLQPYEADVTELGVWGFMRGLIDKYNDSVQEYSEEGVYYPYKFSRATLNIPIDDLSASVKRSNSSVTTIWKELDSKVLKKYDVRIGIINPQFSGNYYRTITCDLLTTEPVGLINTEDIINITFGNDIASKIRKMHLYGKKEDDSLEGDLGRPYTSVLYSGDWQEDLVPPVSENYSVYDDIITTAKLEERGAETIQREIIDSDSIQVTLHPNVGQRLWIGQVYTIMDSRIGLSKDFRLIKSNINLIDPSKSTYTFGKVDLISARDTDENVQNVSSAKTPITDNLDTETSGESALDAHQGKVLYDMMTDGNSNLYVNSLKADVNVNVKHPTNNVCILLNVNDYGNHGLCSQGYYPGDASSTQYVSDFKWLLYRDSTGHVTIPRTLTADNFFTSSGYFRKTSGGDVVACITDTAVGMQYRLKNSVRNGAFHLSSGGNIGLYDDTNSHWIIYSATDGNVYLRDISGNYSTPLVSMNNTDGQRAVGFKCISNTQMQVYGQWGTAGTTYAYRNVAVTTSDPLLKDNIKDCVINALEIINKIQLHQFDWLTDGAHWDVGFIAPELYEVDPNLAFEPSGEEGEYWGVQEFYLVGVLTKAVQELSAENEALKKKVSDLEERMARLEEMVYAKD